MGAAVSGPTLKLRVTRQMAARLNAYADRGANLRDWCAQARTEIGRLCSREAWDYDRFVCILAVTSPRVSVLRNYKFAEHYMRTGYFLPDMMRTIRASVKHYEATGDIRGPKTGAFARNLLGDETALVLDIWMARALNVEQKVVNRKDNMRAAYRLVGAIAADRGWTIAETQAAIWCGVCRSHGVRPGSFADSIKVDSQTSFEF